jgi:AAA ATPase domain
MLGERQQAAAAELAQWWDGVRRGGVGSHAVLLAGPAGWGRSTVLDQLPQLTRAADRPVGLAVRVNGKSLPDGPGAQAAAVRDSLLGADIRRQAAAQLCRSRLRGSGRLGADRLLPSGIAGTISLVLASLAAAAAGTVADDDDPAGQNGAAARAARIVAAVSASVPTLVIIDDADELTPDLAVTVIENLIDGHDTRVLVAAAVEPGSDVAAALTSRARYGPTTGRVHRARADPRMGSQSRAELAGELRPQLTAAQVQQLADQTRTFAEIFAAVRPDALS